LLHLRNDSRPGSATAAILRETDFRTPQARGHGDLGKYTIRPVPAVSFITPKRGEVS